MRVLLRHWLINQLIYGKVPAGAFRHGDRTMKDLPVEALRDVASYFQALSEPTRLRILNLLRDGEQSVGRLAELCECTAANVSRHLSLLAQQGLVARDARGTSVYYRIADASVYRLCDLVCGSVGRRAAQAARRQRVFARPARRRG
jgi:DNA-binding transcriptional ArsR family regulator